MSNYLKTAPNLCLFANTNSVWKQVRFRKFLLKNLKMNCNSRRLSNQETSSIQALQTQAQEGSGRGVYKNYSYGLMLVKVGTRFFKSVYERTEKNSLRILRVTRNIPEVIYGQEEL